MIGDVVPDLVPLESPEDQSLDALAARASALETAFRARVDELEQLRVSLAAFRVEYRQRVGRLHEELDDLELAIAEAEPGLLSERAQARHGGPGLVAQPPAALAVPEPCEGVEEGVVVGADGESVQLEIVADVGHDGELAGPEGAAESVGELRSADAASEQHDPWANRVVHAVRRGSTSAPNAFAHSTWLRPTLCR